MLTEQACRAMKAQGSVSVRGDKVITVSLSVLRRDGTIVEECFFPARKWKTVVITVPKDVTERKVDEACCAVANGYYAGFFHYMTETLPKLYHYSVSGLECPVMIPHTNRFVEEVIDIIGVPRERVYVMKPKFLYHIEKLHYNPYQELDRPIGPDLKGLFSLFRDKLAKDGPPRSIYLSRHDCRDHGNNNSAVGRNRVITNEAAIIDKLGLDELAVGSMNFEEKAEALRGVEVAVTPFGANILNLVLAKNLKKAVFLGTSQQLYCLKFFKNLLKAVVPGVEVVFVLGAHTEANCDSNKTPYTIPIEEVKV
jgi:capsular polysaccharide biosynthesis protein